MGSWDVVDISTEKVEGESVGGYDIKEISKEKVLDTNPNLYLQRAEQMLREGKYNAALKEADIASKYSQNNKEVLAEVNKIKQAVNECIERVQKNAKAEREATNILNKTNQLINDGFYYEALNEREKLLEVTKNHECYNRFKEICIQLEAEIMQVSKVEKHKIAKCYFNDGEYELAKKWYCAADDSEGYYKAGKIALYNINNINEGITYLSESANMRNLNAAIELIRLNLENKYVKRSIDEAGKYYKKTKELNKSMAKDILKKYKNDYKLSSLQVLIINGNFRRIAFTMVAFFVMALSGVSMMFKIGKLNGIVLNSSINLASDIVGINGEIVCDAKIEVFPSFAKYPLREVMIENSAIAKSEEGIIKGIAEGDTYVVLYANGEELKKAPVRVRELGVADFKISYKDELVNVGDEVEPKIDIIYSNDIEVQDVNIEYISSNNNVVRVNNNKLVAWGEGKAEVVVKVDDKEKRLVFNIEDPYKQENVIHNSVSDITYTNYSNNEFGYSIDVPNIFNESKYIDNGQSIQYSNYDENIQFRVGVIYNTYGESATSRYNSMVSNLSNITYKAQNGSSYVISYKKNGYCYYYNEIVGVNLFKRFVMICKIEDVDKYRSIIDRMYSTFKSTNEYSNNNSNSFSSKSRVQAKSYYDGSYMFKDADKVLLTDDDLRNLSKDTLAFLRNEICARKGYIFKEEPYKSYFESKSWYIGRVNEVDDSLFNNYEIMNIQLIIEYEEH